MYLILGVRDFKTNSPYSLSSANIGPAIVAWKSLFLTQSINSSTFLTGEIRPNRSTESFSRTILGSGLKNSVSTQTGIISVFLNFAVYELGEVQKTLWAPR